MYLLLWWLYFDIFNYRYNILLIYSRGNQRNKIILLFEQIDAVNLYILEMTRFKLIFKSFYSSVDDRMSIWNISSFFYDLYYILNILSFHFLKLEFTRKKDFFFQYCFSF